jgi:hypothetical protein
LARGERSLWCDGMATPPRTSREEERRLNVRTLVIASAASASAALVTSRLWIAGTWIAAAMTPVIVALVSEMLARPTDRIARSLTTDSPALPDPEAPAPLPEAAAARRVAERMRGEALPDPEAPPRPMVGERRIYRSEAAQARPRRRRRIAYSVVFGTAGLAFVIGVLALTTGELLAGGTVGKNDRRTTLLGGGNRSNSADERDQTREQTTPDQTQTETQPEEQPDTTETTPTDTTETETAPTTPEATPPGEPVPQTETTPTTPTQP